VECAITRATKEKRVAELTEALEKSDVAFGVRYNKISVKKFESFRRSLPADVKLFVAKNTLLKQAVSKVSFSSSPLARPALLLHGYTSCRCESWLGQGIFVLNGAPCLALSLPTSHSYFIQNVCYIPGQQHLGLLQRMPRLSASQVGGWDPLVEGLKLENAWVFASDDAIPGAVKAFLDFEKALLEPIPKPERAKLKLTDISGVVSILLGPFH
jgi:hypothetical protein